jgi:hypothetical protein
MIPKITNRKELLAEVNQKLTKVSEKDLKWLYCYFHDFDEWPITISDTLEEEEEELECSL